MDFAIPPIVWLIIVVIGVIVFGLVIAYGSLQSRRRARDPAVEAVREQATRELYQGEAEDPKASGPHIRKI